MPRDHHMSVVRGKQEQNIFLVQFNSAKYFCQTNPVFVSV